MAADNLMTRTLKMSLAGTVPDSEVHGANMGPTWGRQDQGGPHVGHMNLVIWGIYLGCKNFSLPI